MNKIIFMMENALHTTTKKHERPVRAYIYNGANSTFEFFNFYGRRRDCYRGMKRFCYKFDKDFRVVYLR